MNNLQKINKNCTVDNRFLLCVEDLSLLERRLIFVFLSSINNDIRKDVVSGELIDNRETIEIGKEYSLSVAYFAEIFDLEFESAKDELLDAASKLFEQKIELEDAGKLLKTRYVSYIEYDKEQHLLKYLWSPKIIPLINQLNSHFTTFPLQYLRSLPSNYALRFAVEFIMHLNKGRKKLLKIDLIFEDIKKRYKLEEKYKKTNHFIDRVIIGPLETINNDKLCSLLCHFVDESGNRKYIKEGKKIIGLQVVVERFSKINFT